jgi:hypothetical protein
VLHTERELDQRAGLSEEDAGVDAGEGALPELRNRDLLAISRVNFGAEPLDFGRRGIRLATAAADELERLLIH